MFSHPPRCGRQKWEKEYKRKPRLGEAGGRSNGMHARVTTLQVPPDRIDDATRHVREQVLPRLSQMEGFEGMVALASSQSGKLQGVAFWESEEALNATAQSVASIG